MYTTHIVQYFEHSLVFCDIVCVNKITEVYKKYFCRISQSLSCLLGSQVPRFSTNCYGTVAPSQWGSVTMTLLFLIYLKRLGKTWKSEDTIS